MKKHAIALAVTAALSMNAQAANYAGVDYMNMEVGSVQNTLLTATFGQTLSNNLSAEFRVGFGLDGGGFDNYNDYSKIVDSDKLTQTITNGGNISSKMEVESILGAYARYNTMLTPDLGATIYGGISQYTINLSSDFITSVQDDVFGPEIGASLFYTMDSGITVSAEYSKYKDFYDASVSSLNFGARWAF